MAALNTQVTELKQRRDGERSALDTMSNSPDNFIDSLLCHGLEDAQIDRPV